MSWVAGVDNWERHSRSMRSEKVHVLWVGSEGLCSRDNVGDLLSKAVLSAAESRRRRYGESRDTLGQRLAEFIASLSPRARIYVNSQRSRPLGTVWWIGNGNPGLCGTCCRLSAFVLETCSPVPNAPGPLSRVSPSCALCSLHTFFDMVHPQMSSLILGLVFPVGRGHKG